MVRAVPQYYFVRRLKRPLHLPQPLIAYRLAISVGKKKRTKKSKSEHSGFFSYFLVKADETPLIKLSNRFRVISVKIFACDVSEEEKKFLNWNKVAYLPPPLSFSLLPPLPELFCPKEICLIFLLALPFYRIAVRRSCRVRSRNSFDSQLRTGPGRRSTRTERLKWVEAWSVENMTSWIWLVVSSLTHIG